MQTNIPTSIWKQQVSMPVAAMAIAITVVSTLAIFEHQTGLPASIRTNAVYGSMPVHSAAPTPLLRRTASTSSISSRKPSVLKRFLRRTQLRRAAQTSSAGAR